MTTNPPPADTGQDTGASASADRAVAASPSSPQAVSPVPASIPSAVKRALEPLKAWSRSRFCGSPAEKLIWLQYHEDAPEAITQALHEAGFAIVPMGGPMPTTIHAEDDERQYRTRFRAQMEVKPMVIGAKQDVPTHMAEGAEFRREYLPRILARTMLRVFEDKVAEQLAQAMSARQGQDRNGLGAKPASAVAESDAPKDSDHE